MLLSVRRGEALNPKLLVDMIILVGADLNHRRPCCSLEAINITVRQCPMCVRLVDRRSASEDHPNPEGT